MCFADKGADVFHRLSNRSDIYETLHNGKFMFFVALTRKTITFRCRGGIVVIFKKGREGVVAGSRNVLTDKEYPLCVNIVEGCSIKSYVIDDESSIG